MPPNRLKPPRKPGDELILLNRLFMKQYHLRLVTLFGGEPGLASPAKLDEVMRDAGVAAGNDLRGDLFEVASIYGVGLARGVYLEGNLRLATVAVGVIIRMNGYEFEPAPEALAETMRGVEAGRIDRAALADWLRANARKTAPDEGG